MYSLNSLFYIEVSEMLAYTHIHNLCHVTSFDQWQRVRLPKKQKQCAMSLVDLDNKLVTGRKYWMYACMQ